MRQDVDVSIDPANSCALFITVHSHARQNKRPALSARFHFEDHIRCVAARQCLQRNRENLRQAKMVRIAKMLHLPVPELLENVGIASSTDKVPAAVQCLSPLSERCQDNTLSSHNMEVDHFHSQSSEEHTD